VAIGGKAERQKGGKAERQKGRRCKKYAQTHLKYTGRRSKLQQRGFFLVKTTSTSRPLTIRIIKIKITSNRD
jgi:hypothetical protein